jgi:hypothetical protein
LGGGFTRFCERVGFGQICLSLRLCHNE